jgi:hypothetical protein
MGWSSRTSLSGGIFHKPKANIRNPPSPTSCSFILFTPPNPNRLRFLALRAISITPQKPYDQHQAAQLRAIHLLESTNPAKKGLPVDVDEALDTAIETINQCLQLRSQFKTGIGDLPQGQAVKSSAAEMAHPAPPEWRALAFLLRISAIGTDCLFLSTRSIRQFFHDHYS